MCGNIKMKFESNFEGSAVGEGGGLWEIFPK